MPRGAEVFSYPPVTYYNENDPKAAAWLRELIADGHIPGGYVDERSICDVRPHELTGYAQQHFFAGIGGWAYALRLAGWDDARPVRTGSCPCQPFSAAGKQLGEADARHLWPVFRDLIVFGEPTITFGEQVASALGREWLAGIRADLEGMGYAVGGADLCAAGVGSPNIRQRIFWIAHRVEHAARDRRQQRRTESSRRRTFGGCGPSRLAYADSNGRAEHGCEPRERGAAGPSDSAERGGLTGRLGDANIQRPQRRDERRHGADQWTPWTASVVLPCTDGKARRIEPGSFPLAHGIPGRVGLLRGYGNAINPWLAAEFILACEESLAG